MDTIDKYLQYRKRLGLSPNTLRGDQVVLRQVEAFLTKPVEQATEEDLLAYLESRELSPRTQRQRRYILQLFYDWLKIPIKLPSMRRPRELPVQPSDLVSEADVLAMIEAFDHPRNKALLAVTYESGTRAHEVLGIRVKDITIEPTYIRIRVTGKTGERIIPLVWSAVYLQQWLNYVGPLAPEDKIWRTPKGSLSYSHFKYLISAHSQKVLNHRIHPHILRHSRATQLRKEGKISDASICELFGWRQGSSIIQIYTHLAGMDAEHAYLEAYGVVPAPPPTETPFKPRTCLRCGTENPPEAKYCSHCSLILDEVEAHEVLKRDNLLGQILEFFSTHPDEIQELAKKMRKTKEMKK